MSTRDARYTGKQAKLILDDGTVFSGSGFGASATVTGEIVFNTGMVGYTETLTDPSYAGQILTLTYPLVGNYGVPDREGRDENGIVRHLESDSIQARGLVVHELASVASHWDLKSTLDEWMYDEGVPGISGIDTRALTKVLQRNGVMMAALAVSDSAINDAEISETLASARRYDAEKFMQGVSTKEAVTYGEGPPVVVIDTGVKNAILRNVCDSGYSAVRVPWDTKMDEILRYNPAGVIISNGPGDPQRCTETIQTAKRLIECDIPTLGICLGAQIIGLAGGAETYKLKYGHRGQNKPCLNLMDEKVYVTSQNHGYCIDPESLDSTDFEMWFKNADDSTVEGIRHRTKRCIAVQFHPEASPGPYDCRFVFEELKDLIGEVNCQSASR